MHVRTFTRMHTFEHTSIQVHLCVQYTCIHSYSHRHTHRIHAFPQPVFKHDKHKPCTCIRTHKICTHIHTKHTHTRTSLHHTLIRVRRLTHSCAHTQKYKYNDTRPCTHMQAHERAKEWVQQAHLITQEIAHTSPSIHRAHFCISTFLHVSKSLQKHCSIRQSKASCPILGCLLCTTARLKPLLPHAKTVTAGIKAMSVQPSS